MQVSQIYRSLEREWPFSPNERQLKEDLDVFLQEADGNCVEFWRRISTLMKLVFAHVLMCKQFFLSAYYTRLQQFIQVKGRDLTLRQFLQQSQNPSCDT